MPLRYFKSLNTGDILDTKDKIVDWTPDSDVHIARMYLSDRKKTDLAASQAWFEFGSGNVFTKPTVPCSILGNSPLNAAEIDIDVGKGAKIAVKIVNGEGTTINVDVVFEVTK